MAVLSLWQAAEKMPKKKKVLRPVQRKSQPLKRKLKYSEAVATFNEQLISDCRFLLHLRDISDIRWNFATVYRIDEIRKRVGL